MDGERLSVSGGMFDDLRSAVAPLAAPMHAEGHRLFLVGGVVRDRLLGDDQTPDYDLTTDAMPDRIRALVAGVADAMWLQGERFGTIGLRIGNVTMEVTTHRSEAYVDESRKPVVKFSSDLIEDLARRDFTVNAIAVDVADGMLHDPFDGQTDLINRALRTPLDPAESFSDDPLRMLRAARFLSRYGLTAVDGLVEAALLLADRIGIVSRERIRDELFRLLEVRDPTSGFALLDDMNLLTLVLPEVAALQASAGRALKRQVTDAPPDPVLRLAVLAYGAGGDDTLRHWQSTLRLSGRDVGRIATLLDGTGLLAGMTAEAGVDVIAPSFDEGLRRTAVRSGEYFDEVLAFAKVVGVDPDGRGVGSAVSRLRAIGEFDDLGPALDGATVMRLLDLNAGPVVGEVMNWLGELRLREGNLDNDEVQRRLLDRWGSGDR
ncbi:MAG: CCA tRNA nucleotidyltransferase [Acidimicrobiales bacterium]|nr:CCA tRNA nucleotidyltransferase [Acidimicrobiales bacterium]